MAPSVLPRASPAATAATRRHRSILLRVFGHGLRSLCLVGAGVTLAGLLLCLSPRLAQIATRQIQHRLTDAPAAHFARMEQSAQAGDRAAAAGEARRFIASIPRPHPADAFGGKYRQALEILLDAAATAGNQAQRLQAGELALAFDPNDSALLFKYGRALSEAGQHAKAVEMIETAFRIRPTSPQILHMLESLLAGAPTDRIGELRQRHYEALALCMTLPTWMSGNLVASAGTQTKGFDLPLSVLRETVITGPVGFSPTSVYLVLPRMPELELRVTHARLIGAQGQPVDLNAVPQLHLLPQSDGFVRITPPDTAGFDDPTVIGFKLPADLPADPRIEVRVECRPSPAVAAVMRDFGSWRHPGVKAVTTD